MDKDEVRRSIYFYRVEIPDGQAESAEPKSGCYAATETTAMHAKPRGEE